MLNKVRGFFVGLLKNPYVIGLLLLVLAYFAFNLGVTSATSPPACPTTAALAAKAFGGRQNQWTESQFGWQTTNDGTSRRTVSVPVWYARIFDPAGTAQFFGAQMVENRITLGTDETLVIVCPVRPVQ